MYVYMFYGNDLIDGGDSAEYNKTDTVGVVNNNPKSETAVQSSSSSSSSSTSITTRKNNNNIFSGLANAQLFNFGFDSSMIREVIEMQFSSSHIHTYIHTKTQIFCVLSTFSTLNRI